MYGLMRGVRAQAPLVIHTPHALPLFREDKPGGKRKREKDRMDPIKSRAPERGSAADLGVGTGGKIGVTGGTLLTQYILKNQVCPAAPSLLALSPRPCLMMRSCCINLGGSSHCSPSTSSRTRSAPLH